MINLTRKHWKQRYDDTDVINQQTPISRFPRHQQILKCVFVTMTLPSFVVEWIHRTRSHLHKHRIIIERSEETSEHGLFTITSRSEDFDKGRIKIRSSKIQTLPLLRLVINLNLSIKMLVYIHWDTSNHVTAAMDIDFFLLLRVYRWKYRYSVSFIRRNLKICVRYTYLIRY